MVNSKIGGFREAQMGVAKISRAPLARNLYVWTPLCNFLDPPLYPDEKQMTIPRKKKTLKKNQTFCNRRLLSTIYTTAQENIHLTNECCKKFRHFSTSPWVRVN